MSRLWLLSGYRHTTISLICMSTHKASTTRCHLEHQAWSGQPAIQVLATAPLRRLALSVLFTIVITSYQTTCTVSKRSSIKGTRQCNLHGVPYHIMTTITIKTEETHRLKHNRIYNYSCETCHKAFCYRMQLKRHIDDHNSDKRKPGCCGRVVSTSACQAGGL